jgi:rhamnosyltransferase
MDSGKDKIALIVPTLNAGVGFRRFLEAVKSQTLQPDVMLVLDSESTDGTATMAEEVGFTVIRVTRQEFDHGTTRQLGVDMSHGAEIVIFLTQDVILAGPDSFARLIDSFDDEKNGAVYGRQLPHADASPIAAHARLFNYTAESSIKSQNDIPSLGIKAAFVSNSFAAYRRTALLEVGGFPSDVLFGEDTYVVAKMLDANWKVVYSAEATCYHSHNYSIMAEFRRYFDIGVFHFREKWFIELLGKPEGEGKKFVISEMRYLFQNAPLFIPSVIVRSGLKLLGYKLGQREHVIPLWLKRKLSMNEGYWNNK